MPPYACSPKDLGDLLKMRGLRLTRAADRQRQVLRAAGKPGPCVPLPVRRGWPAVHHLLRVLNPKESNG